MMKRVIGCILLVMFVAAPAMAGTIFGNDLYVDDYENPSWVPDTTELTTWGVGTYESHAAGGIAASVPGSTGHVVQLASGAQSSMNQAGWGGTAAGDSIFEVSVDVYMGNRGTVKQAGWFCMILDMWRGAPDYNTWSNFNNNEIAYGIGDPNGNGGAGSVVWYIRGTTNPQPAQYIRDNYPNWVETGVDEWVTLSFVGGRDPNDSNYYETHFYVNGLYAGYWDGNDPVTNDMRNGQLWYYGMSQQLDIELDNVVYAEPIIPEPASLALMGVGSLFLLRRRR